ncbi:MAG: C39 family peptidase [Solirubrobacteraceae bacterium]
MTASSSTRSSQARVHARRRLAALSVLIAASAGAAALLAGARGAEIRSAGLSDVAKPAPVLRLEAGGATLARLSLTRFRTAGGFDTEAMRQAVIAALPETSAASSGRSRITYAYDRDLTAKRAILLARRGGAVAVAREAIASRVAAPVIAQTLRNNCEAAALSILLRTVGVTVSQQRLQALFPRSGPLDPQGTGPSKVWGDPDRGYVGRVKGGGSAGGFGVYPGPVANAARRLDVNLMNLTGVSPQAIYNRLLAGHALIAWVGLGDGPYDSWQTPQGRTVKVNFNEHTVVLRGIDRDGAISVSNPLEGTAETWSREKFEAMWQLLGRRALST